MRKITQTITEKTKAMIESRHRMRGIAIASFLESTIIPIPLEAILIPVMQVKRDVLWQIALMATLGCVIGALFGYALGYFLFDAVGNDLINLFGSETQFERVKARMATQGFWFIITLGIVPIPFQIAMLAAGATQYSLALFLLATVIARSIRYFGLALLVYILGNRAAQFIQQYRTKGIVFLCTVFGLMWWFLG